MSIQDWGANGEIVGALAVVASLIYLAMQIRQNTRQISMSLESAKLAAFERTVESSNHAREVLITNLRSQTFFSEDSRITEIYRPLTSSVATCYFVTCFLGFKAVAFAN